MAPVRSFVSFVAAAVACVFAFATPEAAAQQAPGPAQGWELCNETSFVLEVATGRPEGRGVTVQGWLRLRPGSCVAALPPPLARGVHHLYARTSSGHRGGRRQWGGPIELCVDPNREFSIESPEDCEAMGLDGRGFREVQISRREGWRTSFAEAEPYTLYRARAAGIQRLLRDAGYELSSGRRSTDPRQVAAAIAQFRTAARLPANATEDDLIDALEDEARRRSNRLGLTLCNRTENRLWTAIGRRGGEGWESRGWWGIAPGACARTIDDALLQEVYYVHALLETNDGDRHLATGGEAFCVGQARFAILGRDGCNERYYDQALFSRIRTGGRQGLVVEFFDRDFLPVGQLPRQLATLRAAQDEVVGPPADTGIARGVQPAGIDASEARPLPRAPRARPAPAPVDAAPPTEGTGGTP